MTCWLVLFVLFFSKVPVFLWGWGGQDRGVCVCVLDIWLIVHELPEKHHLIKSNFPQMGFSYCSRVSPFFFFYSISNNRPLVILQSVSEEWTELPWLTTSYSSQWTNVVVFLLTFINFAFISCSFQSILYDCCLRMQF